LILEFQVRSLYVQQLLQAESAKEYDADWLPEAKKVMRDGTGKFAKKGASITQSIQDTTAILKQGFDLTGDTIQSLVKDPEFRKRAGIATGLPMAKLISNLATQARLNPKLTEKLDEWIANATKEFADQYGDDKSPMAQAIRKANLAQPPKDASFNEKMEFRVAQYAAYKEALDSPEDFSKRDELIGKAASAAIPIGVSLAIALGFEVAIPLFLAQSVNWATVLSSVALGEAADFAIQKGMDKLEINNPALRIGVSMVAGILAGGLVTGVNNKIKNIERLEVERLAKEETKRLADEETERLTKKEIEQLAIEKAKQEADEQVKQLAKKEADRQAKEKAKQLAREERLTKKQTKHEFKQQQLAFQEFLGKDTKKYDNSLQEIANDIFSKNKDMINKLQLFDHKKQTLKEFFDSQGIKIEQLYPLMSDIEKFVSTCKSPTYIKHIHSLDYYLDSINRIIGFNKKPKVISTAEMVELIKMGNKECYRGVSSLKDYNHGGVKKSGVEMMLEFQHGHFCSGTGIFGNGIYTAYGNDGLSTALLYAQKEEGCAVMRLTVEKDAKIFDADSFNDCWVGLNEWFIEDNGKDREISQITKSILGDPGRLLAIMGIDVIDIPQFKYINILNRGAVIVQDEAVHIF
jgi:effector-binding domain-containing protein